MSKNNKHIEQQRLEEIVRSPGGLKMAAEDISEQALADAKAQLHPLLRSVDLDRLDGRCEFLQAFKQAFEQAISRKVAAWLPSAKAVYKFDAPGGSHLEKGCWDSTVHLLVVAPRLLDAINDLSKELDRHVLKQLKRLGWTRFQSSESVIEIQQVTLDEIRHGVSYGAMFFSLYTAPVKVWPAN